MDLSGIAEQNLVYLTPYKPKVCDISKTSFCTFDVETKDGLKGKELFCWGLAYKKNRKINVLFDYEDLNPLFKMLGEKKHKTRKSVIFVHNLSFDIRFIIEYCIINNIAYFPIISGSNFIACIINEYKIVFVDSVQFLKCSQEKAEQEWDILKENMKGETNANEIFEKNYSDWTSKDIFRVVKHNINDIIALYQIMEKYRIVMKEIANVDILSVVSLASLAMKAYRNILREKIVNPFIFFKGKGGKDRNYMIDWKKEKFVRESYFGGRNEVFTLKRLYNALYIDRVSMYPSEMMFKDVPLGIPIWLGKYEKEIEDLENIINEKDERLGFIECKIEKGKATSIYPILPYRLDNRVMFTYCKVKHVYTVPELQYARKKGYKITPLRGLIYPEKGKIFEDYINKFYPMKLNNVGGRKKAAKVLLNSLYGKFGQEFTRDSMNIHYFTTKEDMDKFAFECENRDKLRMRYNEEYGLYMVSESIEDISIKPFMNVAIASYITANARLELTKLLHLLESKNVKVAYCDTDSITIESRYKNKIMDYMAKGNPKLGDWDIEQSFKEVQFLAPKAYISIQFNEKEQKDECKMKLKGVSKYKIKEICESCHTMDEMESIIREEIEMVEIYMKFKEAHRNGMVLATKTPTKHYSFENLKRDFNKFSKDSKPWENASLPSKFQKFVLA